MNSNVLYTIILSLAYLILFAGAEFLYYKLKLKAEVTRKIVHIITGLLTMLFPVLLDNHWFVLFLCGSFLIILLFSLKFNLLKSINAVDRETRGSILYPIIVYSCYLFYKEFDQFIYYYIPILILAICDPIAALVGKKWPKGSFTILGHTKTLGGSFGFFIAAFSLSFGLIFSLENLPLTTSLLLSLIIAFFTAISEAITQKGYDNLAIPMSALGVLFIYSNYF